MRRRRLGIGAELAPLVLILACLAGSLGLIIAAYRRVNAAKSTPPISPVVAIAPAPLVVPPAPKPAPTPPPVVAPVPVEPPPVEDPTPKALAQLTSAEAEQLLEASKANRKAQALEAARQAAVTESERWRRRQSLIHSQLDTLETKVRKVETDIDALALERDALQQELDARKAAAARAKSRPGQAILPHKGPNGTWRRPVVVECRNGAAIIQPQGVEFGLLELESGFGSTNRFVAAVAREAIRVQRKASPDGAPVVPYIFFLVRPDGIRPYYEARGRLEPLGITFGYELADADWEIEFPNLDDVATWDGSAPADGSNPVVTGRSSRPGAGSSAEDVDLPSWPKALGAGNDPSSPFTFGGAGDLATGGGGGRTPSLIPRSLGSTGNPGAGLAGLSGSGSGSGGGSPFATGAVGSLGTGSGGSDPAAVGPPPEGFPAELLTGGKGTKDPGPTATTGTDSTGSNPASARPAGPAGRRVTAAGRIVAAPAETTSGATGDPGGNAGSPGSGLTMARGRPGQPGGPTGTDRNQPGGPANAPAAPGSVAGEPPKPAFELALDGPTADAPAGTLPPEPGKPGNQARSAAASTPTATSGTGAPPLELALSEPSGERDGAARPTGNGSRSQADEADPASTFIWPGGSGNDGKKRPASESPGDPTLPTTGTELADNETSASSDVASTATAGAGSARPAGTRASGGGQQAAKVMLGQPTQASSATAADQPPPPPGAMGIGLNAPAMPTPSSLPNITPPASIPNITPPASIPPIAMNLPIPRGLPTPTEAAAAVNRQMNAPPNLADFVPHGSIVDKTFEVVVVCSREGVIVQPGNYRVTADALKDREGLFKKQVVALVKNRRAADPKTQVEPRIRFLIQPRGYETYQAARSQFFVSGLTWPTTTQVADPDPLAISSGGAW